MKKYYIVNLDSKSGIAYYSKDFFELVLKDDGFELLNHLQIDELLKKLSVNDLIHIEIGVRQFYEVSVLFTLLKKGFKNIQITLHDAPYLKYPLFEFQNKIFNNISKVFHIYFNNFGLGNKWYKKINKIFVLNHKAEIILKKKYLINNVQYIPHVLNPKDVSLPNNSFEEKYDLLFFGFIGVNKGLDYALQLHQQLLKIHPQSIFYVVGEPAGNEGKKYLDKLKKIYCSNVEYLGFVNKEKLNDIFWKVSAVILPFKDYGFIYPTSGSTLDALKRNKIIFTTPVNTVPDLIKNYYNGFMLNRNLNEDVDLINNTLSNKELINTTKTNIYNDLQKNYFPNIVKEAYFNNIIV